MNNVIIFDGDCNFCNYYINQLLRKDHKGTFSYSPFTSDLSQGILRKHGLAPNYRESFILLSEGKIWTKSHAVVQILSRLSMPWKLLGLLIRWGIPASLRNWGYDYVAARRYSLSKRHTSCRLMTPEEYARFIT